jgi:hypothetical protein
MQSELRAQRSGSLYSLLKTARVFRAWLRTMLHRRLCREFIAARGRRLAFRRWRAVYQRRRALVNVLRSPLKALTVQVLNLAMLRWRQYNTLRVSLMRARQRSQSLRVRAAFGLWVQALHGARYLRLRGRHLSLAVQQR